VVVDPAALIEEMDAMAKRGVKFDASLLISKNAHLIMPYHRALDVASETLKGNKKIGTTGRGIGPAYADKINRKGIRMSDLMDPAVFREKLAANTGEANFLLERFYNAPLVKQDEVFDEYMGYAKRLRKYIADTVLFLNDAVAKKKKILAEGAQGTHLDVDHGTYPFVTSSSPTAGGACTGLGIGPKAIGAVLGVAKAYTTRVGEGPLPTELHGAMGERLRESGQEYGASTGRPRRCGWYDAVAVRYAVRINGLDALALTKLDVLDGMGSLDICTGYRCGGEVLTDMPGDTAQLAACEPIYETLPGWTQPTRGVTRYADLPAEARAYIRRLEDVSGVPAAVVSTGSERDHTIIRDDSVAAGWFR
jgi:adenylosuccinate synthase